MEYEYIKSNYTGTEINTGLYINNKELYSISISGTFYYKSYNNLWSAFHKIKTNVYIYEVNGYSIINNNNIILFNDTGYNSLRFFYNNNSGISMIEAESVNEDTFNESIYSAIIYYTKLPY
jgi:hypothetical protein